MYRWLAEEGGRQDLRRRREILERIDKELSGVVTPERAAQLRRQRASLLALIEHARAKDPDFASLRGTPEFEALFKDLPKSEGDD